MKFAFDSDWLDLKWLRAYPVTHHREGHPKTERWHWALEIERGLDFRGDHPSLMGWATKAAARRAGLKAMRKHLVGHR